MRIIAFRPTLTLFMTLCCGLSAQQAFVFPPDISTDRVQTTLLEVYLAESVLAPDLRLGIVRGSDQTVFLHDERIITNNDVLDAHVESRSAQTRVVMTLTPEGARRMASATSDHVGRPLAIRA